MPRSLFAHPPRDSRKCRGQQCLAEADPVRYRPVGGRLSGQRRGVGQVRRGSAKFRPYRYGVKRLHRADPATGGKPAPGVRSLWNSHSGLPLPQRGGCRAVVRAGHSHSALKGAYLEPPSEAFQHKRDVDQNYLALARVLLVRGNYPAIATHDERIIEQVIAYCREHSILADRFEFQMLYGIRARPAAETGDGRLSFASLYSIWRSMVSLLYEASRGAARESDISGQESFQGIGRSSGTNR